AMPSRGYTILFCAIDSMRRLLLPNKKPPGQRVPRRLLRDCLLSCREATRTTPGPASPVPASPARQLRPEHPEELGHERPEEKLRVDLEKHREPGPAEDVLRASDDPRYDDRRPPEHAAQARLGRAQERRRRGDGESPRDPAPAHSGKP